MDSFCRLLPKIELHAHLNGSLSLSTMLQLMRFYADTGIEDKTNIFFDNFIIGNGDKRNLTDCFQVFGIAHSLTTTPATLSLATKLTIAEFQEDGCCYLEIRSTPRETPYMSKRVYIETIVETIESCSTHMSMITKYIVSINRSLKTEEAEEISKLAIESHNKYPNIVVGIELSGDPTVGEFQDFVPALSESRKAGLKVSLHCAEISNPKEVLQMLNFKPDRLGHGVYIHPKLGGTIENWNLLCELKIPIEMCISSNVKTKLVPDYESHHFKEFYDAKIPVIICTDDKGVFSTSLSQEYTICAETFNLSKTELLDIVSDSSKYIFAQEQDKILSKIKQFIERSKVDC